MPNITSITIVVQGLDFVYLRTDLPPTVWPWNEPATLRLEAARGTGLDYCKKNFPGIPVEVVGPTQGLDFGAVNP
jgi:hypothetical protein